MRRSCRSVLVACVVWFLSGAVAEADGLIYVPDPRFPPPARPFPHRIPRPPIEHFPLRVTRHRVVVEIAETVAHTRVEETFHNPNPSQLEGVYLFPLPLEATVSSFRMRIGGRDVAGEVLERGKAREIYEQIVRRVRDPGLLEYVDRGLFRASVFPIPPRGGVDVVLEYDEQLQRDAGVARYVYPLDTGKYTVGDYEDVVLDVRLRCAQPLRTIHCPSHDVALSRPSAGEARLSFEAKRLRADKDFVLYFSSGEDVLAPVLLSYSGHEAQGTFYFAVSPRQDAPGRGPPKDVVFVVDTSGSMLGAKIEQVKKALRHGVQTLNSDDRFNIIDFATESRRFRPEFVDGGSGTREQALQYIDRLEARGGTNLEEALRVAFESAKDPSRLQIVVVLTDGEPTIGVVKPADIVASVRRTNPAARRLFAFGVGDDLNAKLLDELVRDCRGAAQYLRGSENLEVPLSSFFDKVNFPVLTDIKVEFPAGGVTDVYPRPVPDLFRGEQLELFGRFDRDGRRSVVLRGNFLGEPRVFEYSLEFRGTDSPHLPQLWAARKVSYLLGELRVIGENRELKDEIIRLSKLYGIITPFTSYLILEEDRIAGHPPVAARPEELRRSYSAAQDALESSWRGAGGRDRVPAAAREDAEGFAAASGEKSVEFSRRLRRLEEAKTLSQLGLEAEAVLPAAGRAGDSRGSTDAGAELGLRTVAGKAFYFQGDRWIDAELTSDVEIPRDRLRAVKYLSEEYFDLLSRYPGIGKFLGLGPEVTLRWRGEVISIVK